MLGFLVRRILQMIPVLIAISALTFAIIQLPPGDYLTTYMAELQMTGEAIHEAEIEALRQRYGLDRPILVQYTMWITRAVRGDLGVSFEYNLPVSVLIWERIGLTVVISVLTLLFTWVVSFAVGVYSATRQYSIGDYLATFAGFLGLATPNFMIALILMYAANRFFGQSIGGLFSPAYVDEPWSFAKFVDMMGHMWVPVVVIGTSGTAALIRVLRANLLDELNKPYVVTAKAKGISEFRLLFKYPVRVAIIPFLATVGWTLPLIISGETITSVVLGLPTAGPLLLRSLQTQDMFLAGSFILILSVLTLIGTLISDLLLAWADPRIRYE